MSAPEELKGDESIMDKKAHGSCAKPVMQPLRWNNDWKTADKVRRRLVLVL